MSKIHYLKNEYCWAMSDGVEWLKDQKGRSSEERGISLTFAMKAFNDAKRAHKELLKLNS